jgi:hypothetical protein
VPRATTPGATAPLKPLVDQVRDLLPKISAPARPGDAQDLLDFLLAP